MKFTTNSWVTAYALEAYRYGVARTLEDAFDMAEWRAADQHRDRGPLVPLWRSPSACVREDERDAYRDPDDSDGGWENPMDARADDLEWPVIEIGTGAMSYPSPSIGVSSAKAPRNEREAQGSFTFFDTKGF